MFCPICAAPQDLCISDNAVQASICHCGKSIPAIHDQVCRILSVLWSLDGPTYGPSSDCTGTPKSNVQCEVLHHYVACWNVNSSATCHKWKLTFLQCLNTESSTNGFPPHHKIINASLSGPKDSSHISTSMASFFIWVYHMPPHWCLHLIVVRGFEYVSDP